MDAIRTVVVKLDPTDEQAADIDRTLAAFAGACDHAAETARAINSTSRFTVQKACYADIRKQFGLSANLAVRAVARACAALKVPDKRTPAFAPTSVDYDARIFAFREKDWTFSLTLLGGRGRFASLPGDFQREALRGARPTSATLVRRVDGDYYLHVQVKTPAPEPVVVTDYLGVDLGVARLATDSEGEAHTGERVERQRRRRATARKQYQRRGTKSAKRRLRKMAGRQQRYQRAVNHQISKRVVAKAKALGVGIALEDLSGLRGRTEQTANKSLRRRLGNWGFFQLRQFVEYKALRAGVPVVLVDPAYTSQTCSSCGHCERANRRSQSVFCCKHCGHSMNADENAARNIRARATCKPALKVSTVKGQGQSPRL